MKRPALSAVLIGLVITLTVALALAAWMARLRGQEDWSTPVALRDSQDYRWLSAEPAPLRIAHALGEAGDDANTLRSMKRSVASGHRLMEVDLFLADGVLRCHHGPAAPSALTADSCTFDRLLAELPDNVWLILDIKSDFLQSGTQALALAIRHGRTRQLIFQIYEPGQLQQFSAWQRSHSDLPGPIITTYLAHRSLTHIFAQAQRLGVRAVALPIARLAALPDRRGGVRVLVHPVHDCDQAALAERHLADGFFTLNALDCRR